jgi:hypothetical protein
MGFIAAINAAVSNKAISAVVDPVNPTVARLVEILGDLERLVDATPPIAQPMRYGNKAFRAWHDKVVELAPGLMERLLGGLHPGSATELLSYFLDSFGNATRIDYGTGHETTFVILLFCLTQLGVCGAADLPAIGLLAFPAYVRLVRKLQRTYFLEPAGSHGVWSLDDYQFLVFLFGQLDVWVCTVPCI